MTRTACWFGSARVWMARTLAAAALVGMMSPVLAAQAAAAAQAPAAVQAAATDDEELEEVKVTGTRIQVPGITSANPIESITAEEMRQLGYVNVADALLMLVPQNISQYQPGLVGDIQTTSAGEFGNIGIGFGNGTQGNNDLDRGSFFVGQTIANLRGLDPAFGTRTLTLIDGRRVVSSSSQADIVDMNIIPSNLLSRMDVVTGGASATYGSGAMAGVVNLVLDNRRTGFGMQLDYGVNEAGDGQSPHISADWGAPLFGGRAHALLGVEWQKQAAIRDCAAARDWCRESRTMLTNSASSLLEENYNSPLIPLIGYEDYPARFQAENMRYSQFSSNGVIYSNLAPNAFNDPANPRPTSGIRFTANGTDVEPFAYGFRGASNQSSVMNGDGPVTTSASSLRGGNDRKNVFGNFEFNLTERTTAYVQGNYSKTHGENKNRYTMGTVCARFNTQGVRGAAGGAASAGTVIYFGTGTITGDQFVVPVSPYNQPITPGMVRNSLWSNANFRAWLAEGGGTTLPALLSSGITTRSAPYILAVNSPNNQANLNPVVVPAIGTDANPRVLMTNGGFSSTIPTVAAPGAAAPAFTFGPNVVPGSAKYILAKSNNSESRYWLLTEITLAADFDDPGTPDILPTQGRNSYAFLSTLNPDALNAVQTAFSNSPTAGDANSTTRAIWGQDPCAGFTAIRKVWNPQIQQRTTNDSETWRVVTGIRGRFGRDWRFDGSYQYGSTESLSQTFNGGSNLSLGFAMEAVIDDRLTVNGQPNPTLGQPVCRVTRDGVPQADTQGNPMSDTAGLGLLAEGCRPLNIFGDFSAMPAQAFGMTPEQLVQTQQDALRYAFKDSSSEGSTTRQTLSLSTNGTVWEGWGAGPLTGAFGAEVSDNTVDNKGTRGAAYRRVDLANWQDSFGGTTRSTEGYAELNLPLVSGVPGMNLWSLNLGGRYTSFYNKGGDGTAVDADGKHLSNTQGTFNWKIGMVFEPFDFVRLRMTRSRDMRAAGYRELFLNQPTTPDQAQGRNWWRERTELTDENQGERFGYVRVGNPDLKPESSDTLTMGLVLQPSGWAQGMTFSADYSNQKVKGGIYTPYQFQDAATIIESCWRQSGNSDDIDNPIQGIAPDMDLATCREITFAVKDDGTIDPTDVIWVNSSRPANGLSYQQRNIDFSWRYNFPLSRAFEELPGSLSLSIRASRALEASGIQQGVQQRVTSTGELNCTGTVNADNIVICNETQRRINLVGQIRSSQSVPGVSPRPKWTGNFSVSYIVSDLTTSISARYIGGARQDNTWCDANQQAAGLCFNYIDELGRYLGGSVDSNRVKPYLNFALNGSYNLRVADMRQFQVFGSINNLFDKDPPFTGGGSLSGASAGSNDTFGRAYRMGVRLRF